MPALANEYCCRPASISESHWAESAFNPIHNFAISIARTWIHGSTDLVEDLFTTPLRDFIVIYHPSRPEALLPGKSHRVFAHGNGSRAATSIFIPGKWCVHALGPDEKQSTGGCGQRKGRLVNRGTHAKSRVYCLPNWSMLPPSQGVAPTVHPGV